MPISSKEFTKMGAEEPSRLFDLGGAHDPRARYFHYTTVLAILSRLFLQIFINLFFLKCLTFTSSSLIIVSRGKPMGCSPKPIIALGRVWGSDPQINRMKIQNLNIKDKGDNYYDGYNY
jgi:hypothetical protein